MSDYLEFIIVDVNKGYLDSLIYHDLKIKNDKIISSHFYDLRTQTDKEFFQVKSLQEIMYGRNTGNMLISELNIGTKIQNVLVIFSFDEKTGDITFSFDKEDLNKSELYNMISSLMILKHKYKIPEIRLGFDSAYDKDMCIIIISNESQNINDIIKTVNLAIN